MASKTEVKKYLAYWFQLGKKVFINNGAASLQPHVVVDGESYSDDFEQCWEKVISSKSGECYLEGTQQTIAELLSPEWDMVACSRCDMPVPLRNLGMPPLLCPCNDILTWPNAELPQPREPVQSQKQLTQIRDRLLHNQLSQTTVED
ncbi:MAG: hypothetical protein HC836_20225 [Richelia sp. RM2_1_2]|nr:hypothetical protein [Richelia sp. SM1_7_0]NJN07010.1 hypothetical protein [Richelia sp. RM1_1_1]NJO27685.1 hypothetical protein [Richelia sp. SL_2_1]NJO60502.1 hypothetical protein [Richelia sp. RM2_1_2]